MVPPGVRQPTCRPARGWVRADRGSSAPPLVRCQTTHWPTAARAVVSYSSHLSNRDRCEWHRSVCAAASKPGVHVLRSDHVVVVVPRKFRTQTVGRPGRLSGSDRIRQDDEIFPCVAGERGRQHRGAGTGRAVQDQNGLAAKFADRRVVQPQFRQDFARVKAKVVRGPVARLSGLDSRPQRRPTQSGNAAVRPSKLSVVMPVSPEPSPRPEISRDRALTKSHWCVPDKGLSDAPPMPVRIAPA